MAPAFSIFCFLKLARIIARLRIAEIRGQMCFRMRFMPQSVFDKQMTEKQNGGETTTLDSGREAVW